VSFAAITICVASQRVFIVASVYSVIDSVPKLLDTPSYVDKISYSCLNKDLEYLCNREVKTWNRL
jgi:hypothetical protein